MAVTNTYTKQINTYNGSTVVSGKYTLKLVTTFTKLSTNYTRVQMVGYIKSNDSSYYSYNLNSGAKNILKISNDAGDVQYNVTFYAKYDTRNTGTFYKMFTKTVDIKHNSNTGKRSVRISWTFNDRALPGWRPNGTLYAPSSTSLIKLTQTTYTIKYDANGGTGAPSSQTKTHGTNLKLSTTKPTRKSNGDTEYAFKGWALTANATSAKYFAGGTYATNASDTLYAVWSTSTTTYDIVFDNNYDGASSSLKSINKGSKITLLSAPTRNGYTFSKWNTEPDGSGTSYNAGASITPSNDMILYAIWTPWSHSVVYDVQGGSRTPSGFTISTGGEAYIAEVIATEVDTDNTTSEGESADTETGAADKVTTSITKDGYKFKYWNTAANGSGTIYYPGDVYDTIKNGGTVTLYAIWVEENILLCNTKVCKCVEFIEGGTTSFVKGGIVSAPEFIEGSSMKLKSNGFTFSELIEK